MSTEDGRFTITFNGEIFNYHELRTELRSKGFQFTTDSDTEVLLKAWQHWQDECLTRLVGMWAFAVHDSHSQTLTCARDAFGIKPLFYASGGGEFLFASELPALTSLRRDRPQVNLQRMYDYLTFGAYDFGVETFLEGALQLPPGHTLTIQTGSTPFRVTPQRWWIPTTRELRRSPRDAAEELRHRFLESVRLHLRSDVPVGAALSGGVDSSAIVAAIRHLEPDADIHAFTFVKIGHSTNEERWANTVATSTGTHLNRISVSSHDLALDLDDLIRAQGEPFGSTSIYAQYRTYQRARESGVTVTLDGQGGDELLGGYDGYPGARVTSLICSGQFVAAGSFLRAWSRWPGRDIRLAMTDLGREITPRPLRSIGYRLAGRSTHPAWLKPNLRNEFQVKTRLPDLHGPTTLQRRQLAERLRSSITSGRLQALLRHGDRNSMRWSVESRVPFLTTGFAEFCLSLPESLLVSDQGETKHLFRLAMRGIVPDEVLDRRDKVGFETPEQAWLFDLQPQLGEWMEGLDQIPIVDARLARSHVTAVAGGDRPLGREVWRLINAARWAQIFT